jgi:hypothetical protein
MIRTSFENDVRFIEALKNKGPRIVRILTGKVTQLMLQLSAFVAGRKLSGRVLKVRTGVLRASVHAVPTRIEGTKIIGEVESAGGPAFYGVFQEHGGTREYEIRAVKARALAFMSHGKQVFAKSVVHPPLLPRGFSSSSELENAQNIREQLEAAIGEAIND